ncbi:MAG: sigma-70 family RNA polymerase sigma factor [Clostridia bacterium]|nr:sigma-70 family RNA polymerase sigma factor [Clostridia bacterium]
MVNNPKDTQGSTVSVAPQEDGALLFRAKNGDADAARALLDRYTPLVKKIAHSFLGVPESELDDLCQEGLIALYKAILLYKESVSSFSTFAYICVRRSMLSALKKYNRQTPTVSYEELEFEMADAAADPQVKLMEVESCLALLSRFDEILSEYESHVLGLYLAEKTSAEIAKTLEKSEKSVANALARARKKLSSLLS